MMNIIQTEDNISAIPMYTWDNRTIASQSQIILVPTVQHNQKKQKKQYPMIQTNYYSMLCTESRRNQTIHYNFQGRINEPNITYRSKQSGIKMGYQSMELCLCPTPASFSEFPFLQSYLHQHPEMRDIHGQRADTPSGAIVISHRPLMNGPPLYSCFFLTSTQSQMATNQHAESIERLFQYHDNMKQVNQTEPAHIAMNDFVYDMPMPQVTEIMFHNQLCTAVFYTTPIAIRFPRMKMMGGNTSNLLLHDSPTKHVADAIQIQEGFQEGMDNCRSTTRALGYESCLECDSNYVLGAGNNFGKCVPVAGSVADSNTHGNCDSLSMAHCKNTNQDDCIECDYQYVPTGDNLHRRCRPMAGSNVPDDACVHKGGPAAAAPSIPSYVSPLLNKFFSLTQNGNPSHFGNPSSMCDIKAGNPPNLDNLSKVPTTYSGAPILQKPDATINSDTMCGSFDTVMQKYINNIKGNSGSQEISDILLAIFDYRKHNDGLNPYMGGNGLNPAVVGKDKGGIDCYEDYVNMFWNGEGNFLNFLITKGVTIPSHYNYWNAAMGPTTRYGWDPASIFFNLDGACYDSSTVQLNAGKALENGYNAIANLQQNVMYDISNAANSAMSMANRVLGIVSGTEGTCPSKGPVVTLEVPLIDDPNYTYQECSMIPGDDMTVEPVYYTSQQQFFDMNNSLMGIVFYFIIFLMVYFGTPFMYYFMMCVVLKHGYNYTGSATMGDYLRKPQTGIGGKSRGLSIIFNAVYWMMIFVIYMITFIPGANVTKYNTFIILLMISWVIGYIGVKNNPPPDSCMY